MAAVSGAIRSARLTLKVNRFEVLAVTIALMLLVGAAVAVKVMLDGTGVTHACLEAWMASAGEPPAGCVEPVHRWADLSGDLGGKVMGAMLFVPLVSGLILGVPLVGREIEQRTAATAWALAGSRSRWLAGRLVPPLALVLVLGGALAVASAVLFGAVSGDGVWSTSSDSAMFFGFPVMAHVTLGFAIGLVAGALIGRTLPALIIGAVVTLVVVAFALLQQAAEQSRALVSETPDGVVFYQDEPADLLDPSIDWRFSTPDGSRYLTREEALATVPAGVPDVRQWLRDHYQPEYRGPSDAVARAWQTKESVAVMAAAGLLLLVAFPIVERRRPG